MKSDNEIWKWALVVILLAIFIITANQAYVHVTSQKDYAPPTDYLNGDSWDQEHSSDPGAGQAIQIKESNKDDNSGNEVSKPTVKKELSHQENIDWNNVKNPSQD